MLSKLFDFATTGVECSHILITLHLTCFVSKNETIRVNLTYFSKFLIIIFFQALFVDWLECCFSPECLEVSWRCEASLEVQTEPRQKFPWWLFRPPVLSCQSAEEKEKNKEEEAGLIVGRGKMAGLGGGAGWLWGGGEERGGKTRGDESHAESQKKKKKNGSQTGWERHQHSWFPSNSTCQSCHLTLVACVCVRACLLARFVGDVGGSPAATAAATLCTQCSHGFQAPWTHYWLSQSVTPRNIPALSNGVESEFEC